jgi:hypothetical protein
VGRRWYWTTRLCGREAGGEVDVFNIIFCTQKYRLQNKYLSFTPQNTVAGFPDYLKVGRSRKMEEHEAKASNIKEVALKSWFPVGVEIGLQGSKLRWLLMIGGQQMMAKRVWGRGRSNQKVCILLVGRDPRYICWKRWLG